MQSITSPDRLVLGFVGSAKCYLNQYVPSCLTSGHQSYHLKFGLSRARCARRLPKQHYTNCLTLDLLFSLFDLAMRGG